MSTTLPSSAGQLALFLVLASGGCFEESQPVTDDGGDVGTSGQVSSTASDSATAAVTTAGGVSTSGPATATATTTTDTTATATVSATDPSESTTVSETTDVGDSTGQPGDSTDDTTGVPTDELCGFIDDFSDDVFDPLWSLEQSSSLAEHSGRALIFITAPTMDQYPRLEVLPPAGFKDSLVRIETADLPPITGTQLNLYVASGPDSALVSLNYTSELRIEVNLRTNGGNQNFYDQAYDPVGQRWIQIRNHEGRLVFEASEDGIDFSMLSEFPDPFSNRDISVGVAATNWEELEEPVDVSIETFRYQCLWDD